MSETTTTETTTETLQAVVPAGVDPLDDLTAGELGHIGKLLRCDPYAAVQGGSGPNDPAAGQRWPALAHIAWVWAKRTDPTAKLQPFLDRKPGELSVLLNLAADDAPLGGSDETDEDVAANPTDSAPA